MFHGIFGKRHKNANEKFIMAKGREVGNLKGDEPKKKVSTDKHTGHRLPLPKGKVYS